MSKSQLIYSNSRAKTIEKTLLTRDKILRLISTSNLVDAMRILQEVGYGVGISIDDGFDYNVLLNSEYDKILSFFKEAMPEGSDLTVFLYLEDANNLKACMKMKYGGFEDKSLLNSGGHYDKEKMLESILVDNYFSFDAFIKEALEKIDYEFTLGDKRPYIINTLIDKAIFKTIEKRLKNSRETSLKKYFKTYVEALNFSILIRAKKVDAGVKLLREMYLDDGSISLDQFENLYSQSYEVIQEKYRYKSAGKIYVNAINELRETNELIRFEKELDDYLLNMFSLYRNDIFTIGPIISLFLSKKQEIKMVKLILVCIKNHVEENEIRKRLRALFI